MRLQGVLLGPMMLAMLSVAANLHSQIVNETEPGGGAAGEEDLHLAHSNSQRLRYADPEAG